MRGLRIRLLGDRVLQEVAWKAAALLSWPDTLDAEYVALTQLHADALITLDRHLADAVQDLVTVAPIEVLHRPKQNPRTAPPCERTHMAPLCVNRGIPARIVCTGPRRRQADCA